MSRRFLVTGGCGFIGSHLVDILIERGDRVVVLDCLSYGADLHNLPSPTVVGGVSPHRAGPIPDAPCVVVVGDVADDRLALDLAEQTDGCFHLAAQTHVDRSYGDVRPFVMSNIVGTYAILEAYRVSKKRLVLMSTDEVYGDKAEGFSQENDPLSPRNVYSSLKCGADILTRTYADVFGLDVVIARPANNYGPRQFTEKLVPKTITTLLMGKKVPIYGDGKQVRDWLWVKDCAAALVALYEKGRRGQAYNVGAWQYRTTVEVVKAIADLLNVDFMKHTEYVEDRIRGDRRYALDFSRLTADTAWHPQKTFDDGIAETVEWYKQRNQNEPSSIS
jgi:dTDP-glucose 4,6-dehydratase